MVFKPAGYGDSIMGFAVRWCLPVFPRSPVLICPLTRREPGHTPRDASCVLGRGTSELLWGQSRVEGWHGWGVARGPWPSHPSDCWLLLLLASTLGVAAKLLHRCNQENLLSRSRGRERKRVRGAPRSLGFAVARSTRGHLALLPDCRCCLGVPAASRGLGVRVFPVAPIPLRSATDELVGLGSDSLGSVRCRVGSGWGSCRGFKGVCLPLPLALPLVLCCLYVPFPSRPLPGLAHTFLIFAGSPRDFSNPR